MVGCVNLLYVFRFDVAETFLFTEQNLDNDTIMNDTLAYTNIKKKQESIDNS